jgi:hypothetical protein
MVSVRVKRRVFLGLLLFFLVWPLVHYALSRAYRINHWRFAGFAMYTRPAYQPSLLFSGVQAGQPLSQSDLRTALGADKARIDELVAARKMWGDLVTPDAIGRLILERMPALSELTISIATVGLEPGDDHFSFTVDRFECARPHNAGAPVCVAARP